jgi:hypothetical protein
MIDVTAERAGSPDGASTDDILFVTASLSGLKNCQNLHRKYFVGALHFVRLFAIIVKSIYNPLASSQWLGAFFCGKCLFINLTRESTNLYAAAICAVQASQSPGNLRSQAKTKFSLASRHAGAPVPNKTLGYA